MKSEVVKFYEPQELKDEMEEALVVTLESLSEENGINISVDGIKTPFSYNYDFNPDFSAQHRLIGVIEGNAPSARSSINKTPMHDLIPPEFRAFRRPGRLCPSKREDGTIFYPMLEGMKPYGTAFHYFDVDSVNRFLDEYIPLKFRAITRSLPISPHFRSGLEYKEIVSGIPGRINGINRKSSPGPYFDEVKESLLPYLGSKSKLKGMGWIWGEEGGYAFDGIGAKFVERVFSYFDERIRDGHFIYHVYNASLKDECVSLEKQQTKGIRIFFSGSVICLMLFKKYFGHYMAYAQESRPYRSAQVGINCHDEFKRLYSELISTNDGVLCFDFSKFDKRMHFIWLDAFFREADLYYMSDPDPCGRVARAVLREMTHKVFIQVCTEKPLRFTECVQSQVPGADGARDLELKNSTHCYLMEVVNITPSGMYPTAAANSEACEAIHMKSLYDYYVGRRVGPQLSLEEFVNKITLFTYGDDSIMNFDRSLDCSFLTSGEFDISSYLDCVFANGFIATDENLGVDKIKGMLPVLDGTFLARKFNRIEDGAILAELRDESIYNAPAYSDKAATVQQKIDAVDSAIIELAGKGFNRFHEQITVDLPGYYFSGPRFAHLVDACYKSYGIYPRVLDYRTALSCLGSDFYSLGYAYREVRDLN